MPAPVLEIFSTEQELQDALLLRPRYLLHLMGEIAKRNICPALGACVPSIAELTNRIEGAGNQDCLVRIAAIDASAENDAEWHKTWAALLQSSVGNLSKLIEDTYKCHFQNPLSGWGVKIEEEAQGENSAAPESEAREPGILSFAELHSYVDDAAPGII